MIDPNRKEIEDKDADILSYTKRKNQIHILTADSILARDICERIQDDFRMDHFNLIKPASRTVKEAAAEIDQISPETVQSKVLIIDVRKRTLPIMQQSYNKVVGYNRKDINKHCHVILIGDGPFRLFERGDNLDSFIEFIGKYRLDYYQAAYFFDPFIHYEDDEDIKPVDGIITLKKDVPKRLLPYFSNQDKISVENVRKYFRATGTGKEVKEKRLKVLEELYTKRIAEQYPSYKDKTKSFLSKDGAILATEKLNLYPFGFEELVFELTEKASS